MQKWCLTPICLTPFPRLPDCALTLILSVFLVALVAGCTGITRPAPVRETFLLEPPAPPVVAHPQPGTLRIGTINVAAPFRGKAFIHRVDEFRFETDFYSEFIVTPSTMLTDQTARALALAKPFARVGGAGAATEDAAWVLDGFASALYADMRDAARPAAELDITFYLTSTSESAQTPVWTHAYREHVAMRGATAHAYAAALNEAFGRVLAALAQDLANVKLPQP